MNTVLKHSLSGVVYIYIIDSGVTLYVFV